MSQRKGTSAGVVVCMGTTKRLARTLNNLELHFSRLEYLNLEHLEIHLKHPPARGEEEEGKTHQSKKSKQGCPWTRVRLHRAHKIKGYANTGWDSLHATGRPYSPTFVQIRHTCPSPVGLPFVAELQSSARRPATPIPCSKHNFYKQLGLTFSIRISDEGFEAFYFNLYAGAMKFGETFMEYLETNQERFMEKCCNVEYKRLKKVLKSCRRCRDLNASSGADGNADGANAEIQLGYYNSCPLCDQMFFTELMKEASGVVGCFRQRVGRLLQFHIHNGMQRYFMSLLQCFASPQQATAQECRMLIEYVMMNAVAMRKILKKYDKVHGSANGRKFKSKMVAEHMEILQSPWLIELGAFYMNISQSNDEAYVGNCNPFAFDLSSSEPIMTLRLPDSVKLEYSLTCAICLELVFNPYALNCGHIFCKSCICSAASVMIFQGLKDADPESRCPVCREAGVYCKTIHMMELDLLTKKDCKEYWKERMVAERAEMVRQSKVYWELQTKYMIGY